MITLRLPRPARRRSDAVRPGPLSSRVPSLSSGDGVGASTGSACVPRRPSRTLVAAVAALSAVLVLMPVSEPAALAAVTPSTGHPITPTGLPRAIESLASYVPETSCEPWAKPGTLKLGQLLSHTYPGTGYLTGRTCGSSPDSEHYDGRAVDWLNSIRNPTQAAQAKAVLSWLFAKDAAGNSYANARRLGIMYIIWDGKIWGAYSTDRGWRTYDGCNTLTSRSYDTTCHRDHMHFSLSWEGAMGHTSFWTKKVAGTDWGTCPGQGLRWAPSSHKPRATPCTRFPAPTAPKGSSSLEKSLMTYSGMTLGSYTSGAPVTAVQQALKITTSGSYDPATKNAVKRWQSAHHLSSSGTTDNATWRSLLTANAPR